MVVSLTELMTNLPDVRGDNHKVPMGEADQYIPITIPGETHRGSELTLVHISH